MRKSTFWTLLTLTLLVALAITQCAPTAAPEPTEPPAAAEQPTEAPEAEPTAAPTEAAEAEPNVFVYAHGTTFPDIDPAISFSNDSVITSNCYETLTFYNPPGSDEVLSPLLATSWETNEGATEWTFHLREGVTFHNGDPFNAEAVKGAYENTMEMGVGAAYMLDPIEEIEVVDDYTVMFKLGYPAPLDLIASSGYGVCGKRHRMAQRGQLHRYRPLYH
jgi:peptide/nickel transport system substrate-binding protein